MKLFGFEIKRFKRAANNSSEPKLLSSTRQTQGDVYPFSENTFLSRRFQNYHRIDLTQYSRTYSADQMLDILIDTNPDVSQALYSFLRVCNSGWFYSVKKLNGKTHKEGRRIIDEWLVKLNYQQTNKGFKEDRSINSLINKLHLSFFVKGAAACEVILNNLFEPNYIDPVSPSTIHFKKQDDELIPYQEQVVSSASQRRSGVWEGGYKKVDTPAFFYQPFDARLGDVFGVPPILPVLNVIFFQLQVLQDLQAVLHKVGYPRIKIKLLEEILIRNAPPAIKNDTKKLTSWLNERKEDIKREYERIRPDDAAIHFDSVDVTYMESQRGSVSYDVRALIEVIDQQVTAAVKSLSTIMGRHKGNTETYAGAEVQLYIKGIEAVQRMSSTLMSRLLTFCLNLFGYQGYVEFGYKDIELRSKTELAQWEAVNLRNHIILMVLGFETRDEACEELLRRRPGSIPSQEQLDLLLALLKTSLPEISRGSNSGGTPQNGNSRALDNALEKILKGS